MCHRNERFEDMTDRLLSQHRATAQTLESNPARGLKKLLKGLILAQNERWRRGLGMQVEGIPAMGEPA
jgi:hypothetical protein